MDSPDHCVDSTWFKAYPHDIHYRYNSRGFRDHEWPHSMADLKKAIWCIGDSFTVGLGQPFDHVWPQRLQKHTGIRTINISMDGASNDWIARKTHSIVRDISPANIIVMWSFVHRREAADGVDDEDRRISFKQSTDQEDWQNFFAHLASLASHSNITHLAVPEFAPNTAPVDRMHRVWHDIRGHDWPEDPPMDLSALAQIDPGVLHEIKHKHHCLNTITETLENLARPLFEGSQHILARFCQEIMMVPKLDRSRDGFHFDQITSDWVVRRILPRLHV